MNAGLGIIILNMLLSIITEMAVNNTVGNNLVVKKRH
jgi:hypothetical protein